MKKLLTIFMLCGVCCGYAQKTPPHAASTRTWTVGEQTWSDAIHIPLSIEMTSKAYSTECQRSLAPADAPTWYYYNWSCVEANYELLCPSPWRVPTRRDLSYLVRTGELSQLIYQWGFGGSSYRGKIAVEDRAAYLWSSSAKDNDYAYHLVYNRVGFYELGYDGKSLEFQVRCVK
jgi:hypothetical protein